MAERPTLLCVANFASNTGYAWDFIEGLYAKVGDELASRGVRTLVSYPKMRGFPRPLEGSNASPVELDFGVSSLPQLRATLRFIRANNVRTIYMTDRDACSPAYPLFRSAGVRHIVMHDHTSGERSEPHGARRIAKWMYTRIPGVAADDIICVSDYVARRQVAVGRVPPRRVKRVWNGIPVSAPSGDTGELRDIAGASTDQPLVVCCCRADEVKGVKHLLRAFDIACRALEQKGVRPALIYIGDGPQRGELETIRSSLASRDSITFTGYRQNATALLGEADICVVPSIWQDALPLGVLEPMASGKPVIGTSVGGIPEMIDDGVTGMIVPPGDAAALAAALVRLLQDPELCRAFGAAGRKRVAQHFTPEEQIRTLTAIVGRGFGERSS